MIFGRKKQDDSAASDDLHTADLHTDGPELHDAPADTVSTEGVGADEVATRDGDVVPADAVDADAVDADDVDADVEDAEDAPDPWATLDASKDWRYDGPFDITEVDLAADAEAGIERVDLGSMIVTPEENVGVQLQLQQETGQVQAILAMHENSGLEVALFSAPSKSSMVEEVREGLTEATLQANGSVDYAEGPFGTEIRRLLPVEGPDGENYVHPSRIWLVQGPRWLLRGVLMGEAGMQDNLQGSAGVLVEFFRNIVVNRDTVARVPGDLILLTLPEGVQIEEPVMDPGMEQPQEPVDPRGTGQVGGQAIQG